MMTSVNFEDLGLCPYKKAWDYQEKLFQELVKAKGFRAGMPLTDLPNYLLFCEHPHVFTLGKSGEVNNLLVNETFLKSIGAEFYRIDRGGDVTYHGPGQIVGYPIIHLDHFGISVKQYIHQLEEVIILSTREFGLITERLEGATGVWLDVGKPSVRKICAIGVRASRYVTMHGFALNVNTDLKYFSYINPCGFQDKGVTSMQKELGRHLSMEEVSVILRANFASVFQAEFRGS
jgi:lipoyl(octanoyl) transferase